MIKFFSKAVSALILLFGLFSCIDRQARFEEPPWLGGSSIETLTEKGNYTIYLALMEKANYTEPITKQLFTLFVPNDDAFKAYFASRGISGVDALSKDEAVQLFTLHVLRNPRSKFQLIYEYAWGELQGPTGEYASLFCRKETTSKSISYIEVPKYHKTYKGKELLLTTHGKLVPVFSTDYFEDFFGAPDGSDYTFMYKNSKWETGLNWHNAMVTEAESRTSSGFIYYIDQVVPPMPSIEEYLIAHPEKYSLYYDLAQRFATYNPLSGAGSKDAQNRQLYYKSYLLISNIAEDQGPSPSDGPTVPNKMRDFFTLYCPTNDVLQKYLDNTVLKYYPSIDSVPQGTLYYILQTQISKVLGLKSKISKSYFNAFGDAMTIQPEDISDAYMCSNGPVYDMKKVLEPNIFSCVPGRLYFDKNYTTFLNALNLSGLMGELTNPNVDVTFFAPTNDQVEQYGVRYNVDDEVVEWRGKDLQWIAMNEDDLVMFIKDHIHIGKLSDLSGEGYIEMSSGNFVHYQNNKIEGGENQVIGDQSVVVESVENPRNGMLYTVDKPVKTKWEMGQSIMANPNFSEFAELLIQTQLLDPLFVDPISEDTIPNLKLLTEADYWTAFIPNNNAVLSAKAAGLIPSDIEELKNFLAYHFLRGKTIFDDGKVSGVFHSSRKDKVTSEGTVYTDFTISNSINNLSVTDHSGQVVQVDHAHANALVLKGVVHEITSVFKY
jgi:uncharacterized surface protein with fasciclin (FAS1) repeats